MIEFVFFKQNMLQSDKIAILNLFKDLGNPNSYYFKLQTTYNNNLHFNTTTNYNICDRDDLFYLSKIAMSETEKIEVQGSIHTHHHTSRVLRDINGNNIFAEDSYIRFKYNGSIFHMLTHPPLINPCEFFIYKSSYCTNTKHLIQPLFRKID
jgi:hypothetical protein